MGNLIKPLLVGAVAGWANKQFAPQMIPFQTPVAGAGAAYLLGSRGMTGILAGAAGAYGADMLTGGSKSTGASSIVLY